MCKSDNATHHLEVWSKTLLLRWNLEPLNAHNTEDHPVYIFTGTRAPAWIHFSSFSMEPNKWFLRFPFLKLLKYYFLNRYSFVNYNISRILKFLWKNTVYYITDLFIKFSRGFLWNSKFSRNMFICPTDQNNALMVNMQFIGCCT